MVFSPPSSLAGDALRVVSLAEGDALGILMHLDAKVEAEEAEVAHLELILHGSLETFQFPPPSSWCR